MKKEEVFETLKGIVRSLIPDKNIAIEDDSKFIDDLMVDSVVMVQIISSIEDEFNHEIDERDAAKFRTIGDAVNYLTFKLTN